MTRRSTSWYGRIWGWSSRSRCASPGRGADYEDLVQLGTIGMLKAARNFDFSQNTRFSTYAVPLILGEIKRFLRDDGLIKVSRTLKRVATQIAVKKNVFLQEHKREPTVSELASLCGVSEEEIVSALEVSTGVVSLSEPRQDGTFCLEDVLGADNIASLVENVSLRQAVSRLPPGRKGVDLLPVLQELPADAGGRAAGRHAGQGLAHGEKDYGEAPARIGVNPNGFKRSRTFGRPG